MYAYYHGFMSTIMDVCILTWMYGFNPPVRLHCGDGSENQQFVYLCQNVLLWVEEKPQRKDINEKKKKKPANPNWLYTWEKKCPISGKQLLSKTLNNTAV